MTSPEIDELTARLAQKPQDPDALAEAHRVGIADPPAYADLLERVAEASRTDALAAHWLLQAAIVCVETLRDPKRAARLLREAVERAPKNDKAVDLLDRVYRENGKLKALATALERRADALAEIARVDAEQLPRAIAAHMAAAKVWNEPSLRRGDRALELCVRARDLDPGSLDLVRATREQSLAEGRVPEAIQLFEAERAAVATAAEKAALYRAEAAVRRGVGDGPGACTALRFAMRLGEPDPALEEEHARLILSRVKEDGEDVPAPDRKEAAEVFARLAGAAPRDEALPLWLATLDLAPTHEGALEAATAALESEGDSDSIVMRRAAYVKAAPDGPRTAELRRKLAPAYEASGKLTEAIEVTLALAATGDHDAEARLLALYEKDGRIDALVDSLERKAVKLPAPQRIPKLIEIARLCVAKDRPEKALEKHLEVLAIDAANATSLPWVEARLRETGDDAELGKVLLRAARAPAVTMAERKRCVREAARIAEKVGELELAIRCWKQVGDLDRQDAEVRVELARLYERAELWDDLVALLVTGHDGDDGAESARARLARVAEIQETRVADPMAAAATWRRISALAPGDVAAMTKAVALFEACDRPAQAADVLRAGVSSVKDPADRARLFLELGRLLERIGELAPAADAFVASADLAPTIEALEAAERCFVSARRPRQASRAAARRIDLVEGAREKAELLVREAELLVEADDPAEALARLERAAEVDPTCEKAVAALERRYAESARWEELVTLLLRRASAADREARVELRRRAADVAEARFRDREAAATIRRTILDDGEDAATLAWLAHDAEARDATEEAIEYVARLGAALSDPQDKARALLDEARLVADGRGDVAGAIARYERVLGDLDPTSRAALDALAALEERRENPRGLAIVLERALELADGPERTREIATRLADLCEGPLGDPARALDHLDVVAGVAPGDLAVAVRRATLCEKLGDPARAAEHWATIAAGEADAGRAAEATRRLASLYAGPLGRPVDALAALAGPADAGDASCRAAWVELADRLGEQEAVATRLVAWSETTSDPDVRAAALRGAFERLLAIGRLAGAARVGHALHGLGAADRSVGARLAEAALAAGDAAALAAAHVLVVAGLSGPERAVELVRQAEELVRAGVPADEAVRHAEGAVGTMAADEADELLGKLAALLPVPSDVVDLYRRHAERAAVAGARSAGFARAASVASELGDDAGAARALESAIAAADGEAALAVVERAAAEADARRGDRALRGTLAGLLASSAGGPATDEPRGATLLRRAAVIAWRDLGDLDRAVAWIGEALTLRTEAVIDRHARAIEAQTEELRRLEATLRALGDALVGRAPQPAPIVEIDVDPEPPSPRREVARVSAPPPPPPVRPRADGTPSAPGLRVATDRPSSPRSTRTPSAPAIARPAPPTQPPPSRGSRPSARPPAPSAPSSTPAPPSVGPRARATAAPPAPISSSPRAGSRLDGSTPPPAAVTSAPPFAIASATPTPAPAAPPAAEVAAFTPPTAPAAPVAPSPAATFPTPDAAPAPARTTPVPDAPDARASSPDLAPRTTPVPEAPPRAASSPDLAARTTPVPDAPAVRASSPELAPRATPVPDAPAVRASSPDLAPRATPVPDAIAPEPPAAPAPVAPAARTPPPATVTPLPRSVAPARRLAGEELVDELFEAIPGLELCEDAFAGAEFVVELAMRKLGCSMAVVHLYDINRREFLVAASAFVGPRWPRAPELRKLREAEADPLLAEAMRSDDPILVTDAATDKRMTGRRFQWLPHLPKSVLSFGVRQAGRYLGAIELADPLDDGRFTESDAYALAYVGEHLARFLAQRGIVIAGE